MRICDLVMARYSLRENDTIRCDITQNIEIRYDTMHKCNVKFNALQHRHQFIKNLCGCCCSGCEPGRYSRTTIAAKQPTRAHAQTISNVVGWLVVLIGNNAISAPATMATPPWLTDGSSAVRGHARSTTLQVAPRKQTENSAVSIMPGFH